MWHKSKNSFLVLASVFFAPYILEICQFPIQAHHRYGLFLIGIGIILNIWMEQTSEIDKITQVFAAKKIDIDGKFPRLVKGASNE